MVPSLIEAQAMKSIRSLRSLHPAAGVKKLLALLKEADTTCTLGTKEVRGLLQQLTDEAAAACCMSQLLHEHVQMTALQLITVSGGSALDFASMIRTCNAWRLALNCMAPADVAQLLLAATMRRFPGLKALKLTAAAPLNWRDAYRRQIVAEHDECFSDLAVRPRRRGEPLPCQTSRSDYVFTMELFLGMDSPAKVAAHALRQHDSIKAECEALHAVYATKCDKVKQLSEQLQQQRAQSEDVSTQFEATLRSTQEESEWAHSQWQQRKLALDKAACELQRSQQYRTVPDSMPRVTLRDQVKYGATVEAVVLGVRSFVLNPQGDACMFISDSNYKTAAHFVEFFDEVDPWTFKTRIPTWLRALSIHLRMRVRVTNRELRSVVLYDAGIFTDDYFASYELPCRVSTACIADGCDGSVHVPQMSAWWHADQGTVGLHFDLGRYNDDGDPDMEMAEFERHLKPHEVLRYLEHGVPWTSWDDPCSDEDTDDDDGEDSTLASDDDSEDDIDSADTLEGDDATPAQTAEYAY